MQEIFPEGEKRNQAKKQSKWEHPFPAPQGAEVGDGSWGLKSSPKLSWGPGWAEQKSSENCPQCWFSVCVATALDPFLSLWLGKSCSEWPRAPGLFVRPFIVSSFLFLFLPAGHSPLPCCSPAPILVFCFVFNWNRVYLYCCVSFRYIVVFVFYLVSKGRRESIAQNRKEERIEFKRQDRRVSSGNIPGPWILKSHMQRYHHLRCPHPEGQQGWGQGPGPAGLRSGCFAHKMQKSDVQWAAGRNPSANWSVELLALSSLVNSASVPSQMVCYLSQRKWSVCLLI